MQIIRPDMLPLIAGLIILFLFIIGILGFALLYYGIKTGKMNKWKIRSLSLIILGCLSLGFIVYNWIGYNSIFNENEKLIVGEYYSANSKLTINDDYTWKITGENESICKKGKWEFVMSEDWYYWNIESDNMRCRTQIGMLKIGTPPTIDFNEQNFIFERKK
jgi:hypothetical protein